MIFFSFHLINRQNFAENLGRHFCFLLFYLENAWFLAKNQRLLARKPFFSSFWGRLKFFLRDLFFRRTLCLVSLVLASSISVLGLERVCSREVPRIFFVFSELASEVVFSTSPLLCTKRALSQDFAQAGRSSRRTLHRKAKKCFSVLDIYFSINFRKTNSKSLCCYRNLNCGLIFKNVLLKPLTFFLEAAITPLCYAHGQQTGVTKMKANIVSKMTRSVKKSKKVFTYPFLNVLFVITKKDTEEKKNTQKRQKNGDVKKLKMSTFTLFSGIFPGSGQAKRKYKVIK